jgi:FLVCR family feline leukemia virus subgroup C receptor-related protein
MISFTGIYTSSYIFSVFKDKPPTPPSHAQAVLLNAEPEDYMSSIKRLVTNKGYILLLLSYGMNVGVFYAISTLLNSFILKYFPVRRTFSEQF